MYKRLNWLSIFFIFMLFVLGGLVRSTGSGMGCPDWPKCFGEYVPPTSADGLPENYQDYFTKQRVEKTKRFISLLKKLGMKDKADAIMQSPVIQESHEYNTAKAYIEYINRLWGAATGLVVLFCLIASFLYIRKQASIFIFTFIGFILVMLNALLGAVVVNSNLLSGIVTAHFLAAFGSIAFFMLARTKLLGKEAQQELAPGVKWMAIITFIVMVIQIVIGTQAREHYDMLVKTSPLLPIAGDIFNIHQWFALLTFLSAGLQFVVFNRAGFPSKWTLRLLLLIVVQVIFGSFILSDIIEPISKLFHISIGAAVFVIQFYICTLVLRREKRA